jgi:SP family myo-inositol transporter-like MFS transporter 13
MYYSATLFKAVGFDNATAVGLIITAVNFLCTVIALKIVDPIGRRRIMVFSAPGMIISLVLASMSFYCALLAHELTGQNVDLTTDVCHPSAVAVLTKSTAGKLIEGSDYPTAWSALVLVWMVTYVASYAIGLGNIPWLQGELFRLEVRGIGTSLCTATNWSMNLVIGATFLSLMDAITPAGAFGFYAGLCLIGWLFCVFFYPETCVTLDNLLTSLQL